jgi:hypothetical protein
LNRFDEGSLKNNSRSLKSKISHDAEVVDGKGIESYDRVRRRSGIQRRGVEDLIEITTRLLEEGRRRRRRRGGGEIS